MTVLKRLASVALCVLAIVTKGSCEVSTAAYKALPGRSLDTPVIGSHHVTTHSKCTLYCMRSAGCVSITVVQHGDVMTCQLHQRISNIDVKYADDSSMILYEEHTWENITQCDTEWCMNGGTCTDVTSYVYRKTCTCYQLHTGSRCELFESYRFVGIRTADVTDAGTESDIRFTLHGDEKDKTISLGSAYSNGKQRNRYINFSFENPL